MKRKFSVRLKLIMLIILMIMSITLNHSFAIDSDTVLVPCENSTYKVILKAIGGNKIAVVKEVRALVGLGLEAAKDLVDSAPNVIKEGITLEEANQIKAKLEEVGAEVELEPENLCVQENSDLSEPSEISEPGETNEPTTVLVPCENSTYTVVLKAIGGNKIAVIKEVRSLTGLGLKEAKDLVDGAPNIIKEGCTLEEANQLKAKLEEAGAEVDLKADNLCERENSEPTLNFVTIMEVQSSDPDGDVVSISLGEDAPDFVILEGNRLMFNPSAEAGTHTFTVYGDDGRGAIVSKKLTITSFGTNNDPIIDPVSDQRIPVGSEVSIDIKVEDTDGDNIMLGLSNAPDFITLSGNKLNINPKEGDLGQFTFNIIASDIRGGLSSETVIVEVISGTY